MPTLPAAWASTDIYYTVRKKIIGIGIPFLGKAKLFAGGGYNAHISTPIANKEMLTELCDDDLAKCDVTSLEKDLETYLTNKDNYLNPEDAKLINKFLKKLQNEIFADIFANL